MKPQTFYCPHCGTQLTKSASAWVLGEAGQGKLATQVAPFVACPACGRPISTSAMVEGKYDSRVGVLGCGAIATLLAIFLVVASQYGFWLACLVGVVLMALFFLGAFLLDALGTLFRKHRGNQ